MNERIREVRLSIGGSQKAFGERFGIAQQTYANYETGKVAVPDSFKQQLADMGINIHWLVTGIGPMYLDSKQAVEARDVGTYNPLPVRTGSFINPNGKVATIEIGQGEILVPIFAQRLSAGPGQDWLPADFTEERLPLLSRFIKPYNKEDIFAAEVRGDSMTGIQLFDGDIAFFARGGVDGDGLYVISVDGEVYIKRVEMDPFEKMLTITSENERYQPKVVDPDRVVIMGKVIGWLHHHPY